MYEKIKKEELNIDIQDEKLKYWIWLSKLKKISCLEKKKMLEKYKQPENIWNASRNDLEKISYIKPDAITEILKVDNKKNLEKYIEYMQNNNIKIITIFDKEYPEKLKKIYDSPILLYAKGNIELLNKDSLAIVGSRQCTSYGRSVSEQIAYKIAKKDKCIISGLAKGIDTYAHIGAIKANGNTIAVIGNGLDNIYPYENFKICELILNKNGLIISEYIIGTKPEKANFPARNRIISALSDGILVIEATLKSGALITVDFGLEHGKEIFAIPGNIHNITSNGTNELIKQGANLVTNTQDIMMNLWPI